MRNLIVAHGLGPAAVGGQLDAIGGLAYLSALPDAVPSAANLSYYADIIREKHLLRRMIQTCTSVMSRVYDHQGEVDALLDEVERDVLRISEERFALAVRGSSDGIWDWSVPTGEVYYSPRFKELLGYQDTEFPDVFTSFESHLHPHDLAPTLAAVHEHLQRRTPYDVEYRLRTKAGEYRWFRARGQALWDASGQATRMAGSITDISDRKRLQQRFELAVQASPVALLMVDAIASLGCERYEMDAWRVDVTVAASQSWSESKSG